MLSWDPDRVKWVRLTPEIRFATLRPMDDQDTSKQQMGVRIAGNLLIEAKVLAARQQRRLNDVVEEALKDLLKKYASTKKKA